MLFPTRGGKVNSVDQAVPRLVWHQREAVLKLSNNSDKEPQLNRSFKRAAAMAPRLRVLSTLP